MAERCSHTQCGAPATARVAFDSLACFVWIDPFEANGPRDVGARGAGALCTRHADRLVAPRGWAVQDRRSGEPRLWSDRPAVEAVPAPAKAPRRVAAEIDGRDVTVEVQLPFEPAAARTTPIADGSQGGTGVRRERDELEALLATPTSPLLSRAFNSSRGNSSRGNSSRGNSSRGNSSRGNVSRSAPALDDRARGGHAG